jgi:hypothetical protein
MDPVVPPLPGKNSFDSVVAATASIYCMRASMFPRKLDGADGSIPNRRITNLAAKLAQSGMSVSHVQLNNLKSTSRAD